MLFLVILIDLALRASAACCLNCATIGASACSSCSSGYYLFNSLTCLSSCPWGYSASSSLCSDSGGSKTLFNVDFSLYKDLTATTAGVFITYGNAQFGNSNGKSLMPTKDRGFYSGTSSALKGSTSWSPGPNISFMLWIYYISGGTIFEVLNGSSITYRLKVSGSIYTFRVNLYKQDNSGAYNFELSHTTSVSGWVYIKCQSSQNTATDVLVKILKNAEEISGTYSNAEFKDSVSSTWTLGSDTIGSSFQGFIYQYRVDMQTTTSNLASVTPPACGLSQYYDGSACQSCSGSCSTTPICTGSTCSICLNCLYCKGYGSTECYCDGTGSCCQSSCTTCSSKYVCTTCASGYTLSGGICSPNSTPTKIYQSFAGTFSGDYGNFRTAWDSTKYHFANSPETEDPIPMENRGIYFSSGKFLIYKTSLDLGASFTIGIWAKPFTSGLFFKGTEISHDTYCFYLSYYYGSTGYYHTSTSVTLFTSWRYIALSVSTSGSTLTIKSYYDNVSSYSQTVSNAQFSDYSKSPLVLGKSWESMFRGFIHSISIWTQAITDFAYEYYDEACGKAQVNSCLSECDYNNYLSRVCTTCTSTCGTGCVDSRSACSICKNYLCNYCSFFTETSSCSSCITNSASSPCVCNQLYYATPYQCSSCYTRCQTCSSGGYKCNSCTSSNYFVNPVCVTACPTGYTASSNVCTLVTDAVVDLDLSSTFELGVFSSFDIGLSTTDTFLSYDSNDPWPVLKRGYYFYPTAYMKKTLIMSPFFSMSIWVRVVGSGTILTKSGAFTLSATSTTSLSMSVTLTTTTTSTLTKTLTITSSNWAYLSFALSMISDTNTQIASYINQIAQSTVDAAGFLSDSSGYFYVGAQTGGFTGFIVRVQLYNTGTHYNDAYSLACTDCNSCSTCLSVCEIAQDPYNSCAACPGTCTKGCRENRCQLCNDGYCADCNDRTTTGCNTCTTNASGSPCTCVNAYYPSNYACVSCFTRCATCTDGSYKCNSCASTFYYLNYLCISACPTGYTASSFTCSLSTEKILDLDLTNIYSYGTIGSVILGSSSTSVFPSYDSNDPWAAPKRGYYFFPTSYMKYTMVYSPFLSSSFWIKITSSGTILSKASILTITATTTTSITITFTLAPNSASLAKILTITSSAWVYIGFYLSIDSGYSQTSLNTYLGSVSQSVVSAGGFLSDTSSDLYIGASSAGFTGFIQYLQIYSTASHYNDISSLSCSDCLSSCLINQDPFNSCATCPVGCTNGCRSGRCSLCTDGYCSTCADRTTSACTTCITNASGSSPCLCNAAYYPLDYACVLCYTRCATCIDGSYKCSTCTSAYYILSNLCISACPNGYTESSKICTLSSESVLNLDLSTTYTTGSIGTVNLGSSSINTFPTYESSDPIAAPLRGYYFLSTAYMSTSTMVLSPFLSLNLWIKILASGTILTKTGIFTLSASSLTSVICTFTLMQSSLLSKTITITSSTWVYLGYSLSINSAYTLGRLSSIMNTVSQTDIDVAGFLSDTSSIITIGASSGGFIGFLMQMQIYSTSTHMSDAYSFTCTNCFSTCSISQDPYNSCAACPVACTNGCRSGSCSTCYDGYCKVCSDRTTTGCTTCIDNAAVVSTCTCVDSYYPSNFACVLCYSRCATCTDGSYKCNTCTSSYYFLDNLCISACPNGYTESSKICSLSSQSVLNLDLSTTYTTGSIGTVSLGSSSTNAFPTYESSDPIAAPLRGYYFLSTAYMTTSTMILSPFLSLNLWIKILASGTILTKTGIFTLSASSLTSVICTFTLMQSSLLSKTITITSSTWVYLGYSLSINSAYNLGRLSSIMNAVSQTDVDVAGFLSDTSSIITIGGSSGGFIGFLMQMQIYSTSTHMSDAYSFTCTNCFSTCSISEDPYNSCASCPGACTNGCRSGSCSTCYDGYCKVCSDRTTTGCTTCIDNASVATSCTCNDAYYPSNFACVLCYSRCATCIDGSHKCSTCTAAYYFISNLCISACPNGYTESSKICTLSSESVLTLDLSTTYTTGTIGTVSLGSSSANTFPTYDVNDPWVAPLRGYYFQSATYMTTSNIVLSPFLSLNLWIKILASGTILTKTGIFSLSASSLTSVVCTFTLMDSSTLSKTITISSSVWVYLGYSLNINSAYTLGSLSSIMNAASQTDSNVAGFLSDTSSTIIIGGSSGGFIGFLMQMKIFSTSTHMSDDYSFTCTDCFSTCSINQDPYNSCTACPGTCSNGCRSGSCSMCYDGYCESCSDRLTTSCSTCINNAGVITSCICDDGYYPSLFSCVSCYPRCGTCTDGTYKCNSCTPSYYLLSNLCISACPNGYTESSRVCTISSDTVLNLDLSTTYTTGTLDTVSFGSSSANTFPTYDANDPWVAPLRGYYFQPTTYMTTSSIVLSPFLSLNLWIKILASGTILTKSGIFTLSASSLTSVICTFTLMDSLTLSKTITISSSDWVYLGYSLNINSAYTIGSLSSIMNAASQTDSNAAGFLSDTSSTITIGASSGGFIGFLMQMKIYSTSTHMSDDYSFTCTGCFSTCSISQDPYNSCTACPGTCSNGCRSGSCSMCDDGYCKSCSDRLTTSCSTCIDNAGVITSCICNDSYYPSNFVCVSCYSRCATCTDGSYYCGTCTSSYYFIDNLCISACPDGYTESSKICTQSFESILNLDLSTTYSTGSIGTVSLGSSSTNTFPTYDINDPWVAPLRGYYFQSATYMTTSNIVLSPFLSLNLWIKILASGSILTKTGIFTLSANSLTSLDCTFTLMDNSLLSKTITITSSTWVYLGFSLSINGIYTLGRLSSIINDVSQTDIDVAGFLSDTSSTIIIGGSSGGFIGFLMQIQIYSTSTHMSDEYTFTCTDCFSTCLISQDPYNICSTCPVICTNGCRSGSCSSCSDGYCFTCTDRETNECITCITHASGSNLCICDDAFYMSNFVCEACYSRCATCIEGSYKCETCLNPYKLLNHLCLDQCPTGYTESSSSCTLTTNLVVDLDLSETTELNTFQGFSMGSSADIFPLYDINDPWPSIYRGYYFTSQSYMSTSLIFSPYLSLSLWVKVTASGTILSKSSIFSLSSTSLTDLSLTFTLMDNSQLTKTLSITSSQWVYIGLSVSLDILYTTTSLNSIIDSTSQSVSTGTGFLSDPSNDDFNIGSSSSGFTGFIYYIQIYSISDQASIAYTYTCTDCSQCANCLSICSNLQDPFDSCSNCPVDCIYGCRESRCDLCSDQLCYNCVDHVNSACVQCLPHASGTPCDCDQEYYEANYCCNKCFDRCLECTASGYYCDICKSSYKKLSSLCVKECPTGYTLTDPDCILNTAQVLDLNLDNIINLSNFSEFDSGSNNTNNYPDYDINDPWPSVLRGYYFHNKAFMNTSLALAPVMSFTIWVKAEGNGIIIKKTSTDFVLTLTKVPGALELYIKLIDNDDITLSTTIIDNQWVCYSTVVNIDRQQTTVQSYLGITIDASGTGASYISDETSDLWISDPEALNGFLGFVWKLRLYNEPNTDFALQAVSPTSTCLIAQNTPSCTSCPSQCEHGCAGGVCNLCQDKLCYYCNSFTSTCLVCSVNSTLVNDVCECNLGFYRYGNECKPCHYTCEGCTDQNLDSCTSCFNDFYLLEEGMCGVCALGYTLENDICRQTSTDIFSLNLNNTISGTVVDSISNIAVITGDSSIFYPTYEHTDPYSAFLRGFYFNGVSSYLQITNSKFLLPYILRFDFWINPVDVLDKGILIYKSHMSVYIKDAVVYIKLNLTDEIIEVQCPKTLKISSWSRTRFYVSYSRYITTLSCRNGQSINEVTGDGFFLDRNFHTVLGSDSVSFFKGFIYTIKIYASIDEARLLIACSEGCDDCFDDGSCVLVNFVSNDFITSTSFEDSKNELFIYESQGGLCDEIKSVCKYAVLFVTAIILLSCLASQDLSSLWIFISYTQLLFYLVLLDVPIPKRSLGILLSLAYYNPVFNAFSILLSLNQEDNMENLNKFSNQTNTAFDNVGSALTLLSICAILLAFLAIWNMVFKKIPSTYGNMIKKLNATINNFKYGFMIRYLLVFTLEFEIAGILGITNSYNNSTYSMLNICLSTIFILLVIFILVLCLKIAIKKRLAHKYDKESFDSMFNSFFYEFNTESKTFSSVFYIWHLFRRGVVGIVLVILQGFGLAQIIVISSLCVGNALFMIILSPYKSNLYNIISFISEIMILSIAFLNMWLKFNSSPEVVNLVDALIYYGVWAFLGLHFFSSLIYTSYANIKKKWITGENNGSLGTNFKGK